jgi:hypothetical protein
MGQTLSLGLGTITFVENAPMHPFDGDIFHQSLTFSFMDSQPFGG